MSGLYDIAPAIAAAYARRCAKHGTQPFASSHEMLGVLSEEVYELMGAIHSGDRDAIREETMDVLMVCLHGLATKEQP